MDDLNPLAASPAGFVVALREGTRDLHDRAERTGVIRALLRGATTRHAYALYLRNLEPAYRALERGLERHQERPLVGVVARPALYRANALAADLERLAGPGWRDDLLLLPAGNRYRERIEAIADTADELLVAHAYVRYFGDLSGGQILKRLLGRTLGLGPAELQVYAFPGIDDPAGFKDGLRLALDGAAHQVADIGPLLEEASRAFALTIAVSEAVELETQATVSHRKDPA